METPKGIVPPKEKAQELVNKYLTILGYFGMMDVYFDQKKESKQCAIIACDEAVWSHDEFGYDTGWLNEYWIAVKSEIENL